MTPEPKESVNTKKQQEDAPEEDPSPINISHGVYHLKSVQLDSEIRLVVCNTHEQSFISVEKGLIKKFNLNDGRLIQSYQTNEDIRKMIFIQKTGYYLAVIGNDTIKMMNSELEITATTHSTFDINCLYYNETSGNVISGGQGNISVVTDQIPANDVFDKMALEIPDSGGSAQRCYAVTGTSIAVFNASDGHLFGYQRSLHIKKITSVMFYRPLKYIITASRDGSIKLWTSDFEIRMVFVGHVQPVISLNIYPKGPYIMSASIDRTIRIWSLEAEDEVDLIDAGETLRGMTTIEDTSILFTYSKKQVQLFKLTHLHQPFASVGNPVQKLKTISYEKFVDRILCMCMDGTVHLLSPVNGTVLTSMIPDFVTSGDIRNSASTPTPQAYNQHRYIRDTQYCLPLELLFASYSDGTILRANTLLHPARIEREFKFEGGNIPNCICLYEHVTDQAELYDSWKQVRFKTKLENVEKKNKFGYTVLLLAGTVDGHLISINLDTGEIVYKILAHTEASEVIAIFPNPKDEQIITSGTDNVVKIWQMFPNSIEPVSLVTTLFCAHNATHININQDNLIIGFQQELIATFTSVIYNLRTKERFDHDPDEDHTSELTGISRTAGLNLFASSSYDGAIQIWNNKNELLRKLKLNAQPICMDFLNFQADMLVAFNDKIHIIKGLDYLPKAILHKMVCMEFRAPKKEVEFVGDDVVLKSMTEAQRHKLAAIKSTYASRPIKSNIPEDQQRRVEEARRAREEGLAEIETREHDLKLMRDGIFISNKPKKPRTKIRERVVRKYMALFYTRPTKVPEAYGEDTFDPNPPQHIPPPNSPRGQYDDSHKAGFFPSCKKAKRLETISPGGIPTSLTESGPDLSKQGYIINPSSFIPNSVLLRLLWPVEKETKAPDKKKKTDNDKKKKKTKKDEEEVVEEEDELKMVKLPPLMTDDQMMMDQKLEASQSEDAMHERVLTMDSYDLPPSRGLVKPSAGLEGSRFSQSSEEDEIRYLPSQDDSEEEDFRKSDEKPSGLRAKMLRALKTPTPPPKEPTPPPPPSPPKIKEAAKPHKPIVKLVTRPRVPRRPPTPPTPEPQFLTQFGDQPWFESRKGDIMQRMEKPYQASNFFKLITEVLATSIEWMERTAICMALILLWQQENIQTRPRYLLSVMNGILDGQSPNLEVAPNPNVSLEREFLQNCMKLYVLIYGEANQSDLIIELLTQYVEGDEQHQQFVREILAQLGLQDPDRYLDQELNNLETWNLDEEKAFKPQLKTLVLDWLDKWKARFEGHFNKAVDDLKRGRKLEGRVRKLGDVPAANQPISLTIDQFAGNHKTKLIEVLNYFCEMSHEEEMERKRLAKLHEKRKENTVLVLPPIKRDTALKRLGEMHTSRRYREKNNLAVEYRVPMNRPYPDLDAPFTNKIKLNFAHVSMSPLDCPYVDKHDQSSDLYQPILITLRNPIHQRYFIHEKSYVHCV